MTPTTLVFRDDPYARSCSATVVATDARAIVLDRTVFYPMGGGQPGDTGELRFADGSRVRIVDARKGEAADTIAHFAAEGASLPAPGTKVEAVIDWDRRHRLMRMHSCLHLLCVVIDAPVTGGQVGEDRGRLDFDVPEATLDRDALTARLNELVASNYPLAQRWITDEELAARPDLVKTMSVKPPTGAGRVRLIEVAGVDLQPCGGTHVRSTAEIGPVEIVKIEKKGRINRRVIVAFKDGGPA